MKGQEGSYMVEFFWPCAENAYLIKLPQKSLQKNTKMHILAPKAFSQFSPVLKRSIRHSPSLYKPVCVVCEYLGVYECVLKG